MILSAPEWAIKNPEPESDFLRGKSIHGARGWRSRSSLFLLNFIIVWPITKLTQIGVE